MIGHVERALDQVAVDTARSELAALVLLLDGSSHEATAGEIREWIVTRMIGLTEGRAPEYLDPDVIGSIEGRARFRAMEVRRRESEARCSTYQSSIVPDADRFSV